MNAMEVVWLAYCGVACSIAGGYIWARHYRPLTLSELIAEDGARYDRISEGLLAVLTAIRDFDKASRGVRP